MKEPAIAIVNTDCRPMAIPAAPSFFAVKNVPTTNNKARAKKIAYTTNHP
jgi:hypothetical protein